MAFGEEEEDPRQVPAGQGAVRPEPVDRRVGGGVRRAPDLGGAQGRRLLVPGRVAGELHRRCLVGVRLARYIVEPARHTHHTAIAPSPCALIAQSRHRVELGLIAGVLWGGACSALGHDATHRLVAKSATVNKIVAMVAFMPLFHGGFGMIWMYEHMVRRERRGVSRIVARARAPQFLSLEPHVGV